MPAATKSRATGKKGAAASAPAEPAPAPAPAVPAPAVEEPSAPPAPAAAASPKKKTASKKPVKVVAVVTPNGIEGSFTPEPRRPLIAHLQIRPNEVEFRDNPLRYDPNPPSLVDPAPYDAHDVDMFLTGQEELLGGGGGNSIVASSKGGGESPAAAAPQAVAAPVAPSSAKSMPCFQRSDLMVQFRGTVEEKKLPATTDVACFWCVHPFDWTPCVIPEREVNGVYNVYGNFCCPQCAVAYLLSEPIDPHVKWERMALLQRIYDQSGKGRVFPAPVRESLKLFGGPMTIETFRATATGGTVRVDLHMPPMVSILGSIDTKPIDFFDTNVKGGGAAGGPVLPQRSVEEGLRLKRTKPLKDRESTLDTVMNIRIGGR